MGRVHHPGQRAGRRVAWWAAGATILAAATVAAAIGVALLMHFRTASASDGPHAFRYDAVAESFPEALDAAATVQLRGGIGGVPNDTPENTPSPTAAPRPTSAADPAPTATPKPMFDRPANGGVTTAMRPGHPNGVDIGVPIGAPIHAVRDGVVSFAGGHPCCEYGYYVTIEHDGGWTSLYAHMSAFQVRAGERVQQGQRLGLAGDTGYAHGSHLHFELRHHGLPIDPLLYFPPR